MNIVDLINKGVSEGLFRKDLEGDVVPFYREFSHGKVYERKTLPVPHVVLIEVGSWDSQEAADAYEQFEYEVHGVDLDKFLKALPEKSEVYVPVYNSTEGFVESYFFHKKNSEWVRGFTGDW